MVAQLFWEVGLSDEFFDLGGNNDRTFTGLLELVPYQLAIDLSESFFQAFTSIPNDLLIFIVF